MRKPLLIAAIFFASGLTGCLNQAVRNAGTPGVGDQSILTAIDGIDEEDRKNTDTEYWLKCDNDIQILHSKIIEGDDGKEFLRFDGKQIKDGYKCGLEVWNKKLADRDDYKWLSEKADGTPAKGLLYGSSYGVVTERKLEIELWKAYTKKIVDSFKAVFAVTFAGEEEIASEQALLASLICGSGDDQTSHASAEVVRVEDSRDAKITITDLPVEDLKDVSCATLKVVEKAQDDSAAEKTYEAALTDVTFSGEFAPEKDKEFSFPTQDEEKFVLKLKDSGPIDAIIRPGECFNIILGQQECGDDRKFDLPYAKNYIVGHVKGRLDNGRGERAEYIVAMGEKGLGALQANVFDIEMLNKAKASDDELVRKSFNYYKVTGKVQADLEAGKLLTAARLSGEAYEGEEVARESLADVKFLHVETLYSHGFHWVEDLNAQSVPLSWLATLEAKKEDATLEFVVGGVEKAFISLEHPVEAAQEEEAGKLLTFEAFVADAKDGDLENWQAFQKAPEGESDCELADGAAVIEQASDAILNHSDGLGAKLAACKADLTPLADLETQGYEVAIKGYTLSWKTLSPQD